METLAKKALMPFHLDRVAGRLHRRLQRASRNAIPRAPESRSCTWAVAAMYRTAG